MDCSPLGYCIRGILQARILEWVAMPSSRGSFRPRDRTPISYVFCTGRQFFTTSATWEAQWFILFATPWSIQSMASSRPECWSGEPLPSPGDLPNPGIKPRTPTLQADSLPAEPRGKPHLHIRPYADVAASVSCYYNFRV